MKRNPRPWTEQELALLGTRPDAEVADLIGRTFGTVWQKRRALGISHARTTIPQMDLGRC